LPGVKDRTANDSVLRLLCRCTLEAELPLLPLRNEATDSRILIDGYGLHKREFLRSVRIDPASHLAGRPHQIMLRFIARDNSSGISGDLPPEVVFNKGINLGVLYNHVLERVAYLTYPSIISIYSREGWK
jgi:hypothetical protein